MSETVMWQELTTIGLSIQIRKLLTITVVNNSIGCELFCELLRD